MTARARAAWLLGLVLMLGLGLAVWRLAPVPADDVRLVAAATPVIVWAIALLVLGQAPATARTGLETEPAEPGSRRRFTPSRWSQPIAQTLRARGLSGRNARYRVPLYLVVGPPGSGKSTLLERSELDLDPPCTIEESRWWIGSDAIFVEVSAGSGSDEAILRTLRRFRPASPVNGVILVVSPADLTLADAQERRQTGAAIARFLSLVQPAVRARLPVYVLLSKLDLTPGFSEFFDRTEAHERRQLWGFSLRSDFGLTETHAQALEAVRTGIRELVHGTRLRLVEWLSRESDARRGGRILTFSAQVAALDPIVDSILAPLLPSEARKRPGMRLRGIYLTSARQDALSIDPLLPELAERFRMPRTGTDAPDLTLGEEENGYFVGGSLRKAILSEGGLAGAEPRAWYDRPAFGLAAVAASVAIAILSIAPTISAFRQWATATAVPEAAAAGIGTTLRSADPKDLDRIVSDLGTLEAIQLDAPNNLFPRGALSPGQVGDAASRSYEDVLRFTLLPHLVALLEADLVDLNAPAATLRERQAAATSPATGEAGAQWLRSLTARLPDAKGGGDLLTHGSRALVLASGPLVDPAYLDASRRLLAYRDGQP